MHGVWAAHDLLYPFVFHFFHSSTGVAMFKKIALAVSLSLIAAGGAFAQTKWDLPSAYAATNFHTENLVQFAADVDKATAGKLKITVHPNASLFKAPEIKRAVQTNQAQLGEILLSNFSNEWQIFGIDGIPFVADSYDEAAKLWNSGADLKGYKWRAYNPATSRMAELLGAQPVTVQAAEVSQAFATGVTDSMMSSGSTGWDAKLHETVKQWYDLQAWLPKNAVIVNKAAFDALDAPTKAAVMKAAADAEVRGFAASKKANGETLDKLKGGGMAILPPSAALKADMKKVGDTMLKEWLEKAGPEGKQLVDAFLK
jgi:TRAP-type transport system periplasmic protein